MFLSQKQILLCQFFSSLKNTTDNHGVLSFTGVEKLNEIGWYSTCLVVDVSLMPKQSVINNRYFVHQKKRGRTNST